jgi:hypothetical protein
MKQDPEEAPSKAKHLHGATTSILFCIFRLWMISFLLKEVYCILLNHNA